MPPHESDIPWIRVEAISRIDRWIDLVATLSNLQLFGHVDGSTFVPPYNL